jgi:hypothetical protein
VNNVSKVKEKNSATIRTRLVSELAVHMNVTNTVGLFVVVWLVAQMPQTTDKS